MIESTMPRQARLDAAGTLHHVIIRGIERRKIFLDNTDRDDFLDRCGVIFPATETACYAFALLPNHAHLLVRTGAIPLSTVMARLLTGYAVHFNRVHKRHGRLFQNRYKSIVCQEDPYLRELVRYIHLNPMRARIVTDLDALASYPYTGHGALMGKRTYPWQDVGFVVALFGTPMAYLDYMREGLSQGKRPDLTGGGLARSHGGWTEIKKGQSVKGDARILGGSQFVLDVLSRVEQNLDHHYRLKAEGVDITFVERKVTELCGCSREDLYCRGRQRRNATARALLSFFAVRELGMTQTEVGERLAMTQPGVAAAVARGERLAREKGYALLPPTEKT